MINLYLRLVRYKDNQKLFLLPLITRMKNCVLLKIWGCLPNNTRKRILDKQGIVRIVDPLNTTINAPPKPAIPLARLPDEQLVTRSRKNHG